MLRNLINCHEQLGDYDNLRVVRALLHCDHRTPPGQAAGMVPYHGDEGGGSIKSNGHGHGHGGGGEGKWRGDDGGSGESEGEGGESAGKRR